jgi:hypothetical protein
MVQPKKAMDPGLVYDSSYDDWARFVCGSGQVPDTNELCANGKIDPSDLNYPTIAIGDLAGKQTVKRTVRNVGQLPEIYTPQIEGLAGIRVTVTPRLLVVLPGGTASYRVKFEHNGAPLDQYAFGKLDWRSNRHTVSSTLAIRPQTVKVPEQVNGTGTSGSVEVPITAGYTGTLSTTVTGLVPATTERATLKNPSGAAFPSTSPAGNDHVAKFTVAVPAGTKHVRLSTFDADYPAGTDLDLFVYKAGTTALLASSAGGSSEEEVNLPAPAGGSYDIYVDFSAGKGEQAVKLNHWEIQTPAGNLTATPASQPVQAAGHVSVTATWTGLTANTHYLGRLGFTDGADGSGATLVRIDS